MSRRSRRGRPGEQENSEARECVKHMMVEGVSGEEKQEESHALS